MSGGRSGSLLAIAGISVAVVTGACGGDRFTSGEPEGGIVGDDARAAPDSAPADAAREPTVDAAPPDAGAGWCATQATTHTFCEDFLHGVPDKLVGIDANAMLVPDTSDFESAPQSMEAVTPKLGAKGDSATALGTRDFSSVAGTQFTLASYFKIASSCFPANGQTGQIDPVTIAVLEFPEASYGIAIEVAPGVVELVEVETGPDGGITSSPQQKTFNTANLFDAWQPWTITINGSLVTKTISLTVGTVTVIPAQTALKGATLNFLQHPTLLLGASVKNDQGMSPGCKVNVDDILFDVRTAATPAN